jgi:hypothetical protein
LWDLQINASNDNVNRFSGVFLEVRETLRWALHKCWLYTFQISHSPVKFTDIVAPMEQKK